MKRLTFYMEDLVSEEILRKIPSASVYDGYLMHGLEYSELDFEVKYIDVPVQSLEKGEEILRKINPDISMKEPVIDLEKNPKMSKQMLFFEIHIVQAKESKDQIVDFWNKNMSITALLHVKNKDLFIQTCLNNVEKHEKIMQKITKKLNESQLISGAAVLTSSVNTKYHVKNLIDGMYDVNIR